jgi:ubiquitin carboxyl-terminal hydrolase MINDY-1/2
MASFAEEPAAAAAAPAAPSPPPPSPCRSATATANAANPAAAETNDEPTYEIKRVRFFGRDDVPIFLQNVNGPCPLLALANVLSLRNRLPAAALPDAAAGARGAVVRQSRLVAAVADRLVAACDELVRDSGGRGASAENAAQVLSDSIDALAGLARGLDVNVRFGGPAAFEPTRETAAFDLLGTPLLHGWVPDPALEPEAHALMAARGAPYPSYNQAVELLLLAPPSAGGVAAVAGAAAAAGGAEAQGQGRQGEGGEEAAAGPAAAAAAAATDADEEKDELKQVVERMLQRVMREVCGEEEEEEEEEEQQAAAAAAAPSAATATAAAAAQAAAIGAWLERHCSQLTPHGLSLLRSGTALRDNQLGVLFRNNHFSVALYRAQAPAVAGDAGAAAGAAAAAAATEEQRGLPEEAGGDVFLLVTDQGYARQSGVCWERLDSVHGDTTLCSDDFKPYRAPPPPPPPPQSAGAGAAAGAAGGAAAAAATLDPETEAAVFAAATEEAAGGDGAPPPPMSADADADFALAVQLQMQEDEAARAERARLREQREQREEAPGASSSSPARRPQQNQPPTQEGGSTDFVEEARRQLERVGNEAKEKCLIM